MMCKAASALGSAPRLFSTCFSNCSNFPPEITQTWNRSNKQSNRSAICPVIGDLLSASVLSRSKAITRRFTVVLSLNFDVPGAAF